MDNIIAPTPLKTVHSPPPFPVDRLPAVLRDFVRFVAEVTQVYPDMPATVTLAALAVCLQGKAKVRFSPFWSEELNLYVLTVASPGERKSAVYSAVTEPINRYVANYNAEHLIDCQTYRNSKKMLETKLNKAIEKGEENETVRDIQTELNALVPVKEKKLITTDVTAEALAAIMSENDGIMGIMSPEGGIFDVISGMYSGSVTNLNIFLLSYDGEPVKIDRKYGSIVLSHPLLTFGICAQPQVLNNVINNPQFLGKGLTQRFLFCLPDSMIGRRKLIRNIDGTAVTAKYRKLIERLLNIPRNDSAYIDLSPEASAIITDYADKIEFQMSDNGRLADYREFFGKLTGKTLRIAGLLHMCENDITVPISGDTMLSAVAISRYFGQQYLKMMCADTYDDTPRYLLDKILAKAEQKNTDTLSLRDIKRTARRLNGEQITDALEILTSHNYLTMIPAVRDGSRRKESYQLNPTLSVCHGQNGHCPDIVPPQTIAETK